jgi:cardiolipin synthase
VEIPHASPALKQRVVATAPAQSGFTQTLKQRWKLAAGLMFVALLAIALVVGFLAWTDENDPHDFRLRIAVPNGGEPFSSALYQSVGLRMQPGHQISFVNNGAVFDALVRETAQARSSVHIVMYIWEKGGASDRVSAALVERARAGVHCRILVDAFGSPGFSEHVQPALQAAGCEVRVFRPLPGKDELARNHRKVAVFDGKVAIVGGFGVRDNWLGDGIHGGSWRETNVRFAGSAVAEAQQAFAENWQEAGGALLPMEAFPAPAPAPQGAARAAFIASSASPVVTRAERITQLLLAAAKRRIWITNAYFVPSGAILEILGRKAAEGVDVRLLAPGSKSDSKTSFGAQKVEYESLIERGVRVWEYAPSMLHAKTLLVDDGLSLVGSINLEPLSLSKLEEVALIVEDAALATELARQFTRDCTQAQELSAR